MGCAYSGSACCLHVRLLLLPWLPACILQPLLAVAWTGE